MIQDKPIAEIILIGWESSEEWEEYFSQKYLTPIENQYFIKSDIKLHIKIYRLVQLVELKQLPYLIKFHLIKDFIESAIKPINLIE